MVVVSHRRSMCNLGDYSLPLIFHKLDEHIAVLLLNYCVIVALLFRCNAGKSPTNNGRHSNNDNVSCQSNNAYIVPMTGKSQRS